MVGNNNNVGKTNNTLIFMLICWYWKHHIALKVFSWCKFYEKWCGLQGVKRGRKKYTKGNKIS